MRDLFTDYLAARPELAVFFATAPQDLLQEPPRVCSWTPGLASVSEDYQSALGNTRSLTGDEIVIATGQQPGLLTGPLYTIYKAATAIRLASEIEKRFHVRSVPLFWVASVDHDFEEVRTAHILTKHHTIASLTYAPERAVDGLPMYRVPAQTGLHQIIDQAAHSARGSEHRDEVAAFLHESLDAAESLADWFARILARLFRDTPLILFSPHLPTVRALAAPVLKWEIAHPLELTRLLNEAGERLTALGYRPQIVKDATECNFFLEVDQFRRKVRFEKGHYIVPEARLTFSTDEMLGLLQAAPERFTSNVALRCLEQQHLFSPAAYVGGPGEVAYWAQLRPLFDALELAMPAVYPRARAVITDLKLNALLKKVGLTVADIASPEADLLTRALKATTPDPALNIVQKHRRAIESALDDLADGLNSANKSTADMARTVKAATMAGLDRLENSVARADQARVDAVANQVKRLKTELMPLGKPQERVINIFSYLFEHGWDLIPRIVREINVDHFSLKEIEL